MEAVYKMSAKRLKHTSMDFSRYLLDIPDWSDRLISITGTRGSGKTTLMLQVLKKSYGNSPKAIYMSLDNTYFTTNKLSDIADTFATHGGQTMFLDEVHKYPNWSIELKNIYDEYPELNIVFSGSSILELYSGQGDLSRRLSTYHLAPLSFREFLELEYKINIESISLNDILKNHIDISHAVCDKIRPLAYFKDYLEFGALPFYRESRSKYHERLINIVNMTLDYDLPSISPIDYSHVVKLKQLLKIISDLVPYKPNISKLAAQTGIDRKTVLKYLDLLKRSELTIQVNHPGKSDSMFTKPEKIYLGNPNFMFSLCDDKPNRGTLRETFFAQQLSVNHSVNQSKSSDFLIDNTYTFEIGGKNKDFKQISDTENSYVAADEIEYGYGNKIPLWMFGLMY